LVGAPVRTLVVDDYQPWRRFVSSTLSKVGNFQIVGEAIDGAEAVLKAEELRPNLILLDIGLPKLNGIQAALRIRQSSPTTKILVVSEDRSWEIAKAALRAGANGYLVKSDAGSEIVPAVQAVLAGKQFVSSSLTGHYLSFNKQQAADPFRDETPSLTKPPKKSEFVRRHELGLYFDERHLIGQLTQFTGTALREKNAVIVAATQSHWNALLPRLHAEGLNVAAAVEDGSFVALNAADTLAKFMIDGRIDSACFMEMFADLMVTATKSATCEHPRISIFGECAYLLWAEGKAEAAIEVERLGNQLAEQFEVEILCGYSLRNSLAGTENRIFQVICAEHSAVRVLDL